MDGEDGVEQELYQNWRRVDKREKVDGCEEEERRGEGSDEGGHWYDGNM